MNWSARDIIGRLAQRQLPSHDQLTRNELMPKSYQPKLRRGQAPSKEELNALFEYRDGKLYWKIDLNNQTKAGDEAGSINSHGYVQISLKDRKHQAHRLIWIMHGNQPCETIDHINRNRSDNRIENLRAAANAENICNSGLRKDNTSGVKGVSWRRQNNKWSGKVCYQNKQYHAGCFDDKDACEQAVKELRSKLHGEFANHARTSRPS